MCKSQHAVDVRFQYEKRERKNIHKSMKEIRAHLNMQPLVLQLLLRVKKAQKLSHLKKGLLTLMIRLRCSSGMEIRASATLALTIVAWAVHHPLTLLHLSPLLRSTLMMMKKKRKEKKRMMTNRASRRPLQHLFGA
jgi:hypothetical protein